MAERKFTVLTSSRNGKIVAFTVSDALDPDESNDGHPDLAVFHVSQRYTEDEQKQRARTYANYMNKIVEATRIAYEQNQLIDMIKA